MRLSYKSLFDLSGKTAVVTGGIGILGKHFCRGLAEFGANVAVIDLEEEPAAGFAGELEAEYDIKAVGIGCDVSEPASVEKMVARVVEQFGHVNILHNNAASKSKDLDAFFAPFEEYSIS